MKSPHDMKLETRGFIESLMAIDRSVWSELIDSFALYLQVEYSHLASDNDTWTMVKNEYEQQASELVAFVDTVNTDVLDVTGLDGQDAAILSQKLRQWNGKGTVYMRYQGKRVLSPRIRFINLYDKFIQSLPNYDDLVNAVKLAGDSIHYERIPTPSR